MADNVIANSGDGLGPTFATDDATGVHHPYVKVEWGADNTQTPVSSGASALPIQDGGNSITVDGTVAATQSGTWNIGTVTTVSGVVQVGDNSTTLSVDDGAGSLTVDGTVAATQSGTWDITNVSGTVSLPTGASTSANQTTIIGHLDGVEGLLTTIDADTSVLNALSKAEDAGHTTGDTGIMALAVRNDSDTSLAGTTLDYTPLQVDANGYLKVNIKAGAGSGGTASTDDAAFTAASGSGTPIMGFATSDSVDSGDVGVLAMTTNRQLKVTVYNSGGTELTPTVQYAVDTAAGGTDSGSVLLAVRDDSLTTLTPVDGDYVPLRVSSTGALHVTGGGGGTEYTVDAAAPAAPTGATFVMERDDALATLTEIEGDWTNPRSNANGALWVAVDGTVPVSNATLTTIANNTANLANCIVQDDAPFTPATGYLMMIGGEFDDSAPDSVNEGDAGNIRITGNRSMHVTLRDGSGNERGANVNASNQLSVSVDNTVTVASHAVTNAGTFAVQESGAALTALQVIDNPVVVDDAAFTPATTSVMMAGFEFDDVTPDTVNEGDAGAARMSANRNIYTQIRDAAGNERGANVNASGQLSVSVDNTVTVASHAVTNAGTFAVQESGSALTALQLIDNPVVAHDAAVSGSTGVSVIGFEARSTEPTAVASADATRGVATLLGKQVVLPFAIPGSTWSYASPSAVTDTANDEVKAAGTGSERHYITGIQVFNGHDTVGTEVVIKDGTTTVIWRGWAEQTGGGCSATFNPPLRGSAATTINVANITTGSSTYFNLQGFTAAE